MQQFNIDVTNKPAGFDFRQNTLRSRLFWNKLLGKSAQLKAQHIVIYIGIDYNEHMA